MPSSVRLVTVWLVAALFSALSRPLPAEVGRIVLVEGTFEALEVETARSSRKYPLPLRYEFEVATASFRGTGVVCHDRGLVAVGGQIFRGEVRATKLLLRDEDGTRRPGVILGQLHGSGLAFILPGPATRSAKPSNATDKALQAVELERTGKNLVRVVRQGTTVPLRYGSHARFRSDGSAPAQSAAVFDTARAWAGLLVAIESGAPPVLVPADRIRKSAEQLWASRQEPGPGAWLGVELQNLSRHLKKAWDAGLDGPVVCRVFPGSPAGAAGLQIGDILYRLGDWTPAPGTDTQAEDFADRVSWHRPGTRIAVKLLRGQEQTEATVTLARAPATQIDSERVKLPQWGLELAELTQDVREALLLPQGKQGVVAYKVEKGTEASVAGLAHLDLILEVDGATVASPQAVRDLLSSGRVPHRLLVERRALTRFLVLGAKTGTADSDARAGDVGH